MNRKLIRNSLSNAVYFSFITFILVWFGGLLYTGLEKTVGKLSMGTTVIIILSLILIIFLLAITNLFLTQPVKKRIKFGERVLSILVFLITSAVILGILSFLFWFEI